MVEMVLLRGQKDNALLRVSADRGWERGPGCGSGVQPLEVRVATLWLTDGACTDMQQTFPLVSLCAKESEGGEGGEGGRA